MPTDVMTAYNQLSSLAATGRDFVHGEVYNPPVEPDHERMSRVIGKGFDFTRTISVLDIVEGDHVEGEVRLRIIKLDNEGEPRLFLRTWLDWTTSAGSKHTSYACYDITADAAANLAQEQPCSDDLSDLEGVEELSIEQQQRAMNVLFESFDQAASLNAVWEQTFPGSDLYDDGDDIDLATAGVNALYHVDTVLATHVTEPQLVCMLSDTEMGAVHADELDNLLTWAKQQPEVAAVSS